MLREINRAQLGSELRAQARQLSRQAWNLLRMADRLSQEEGGSSAAGGELQPKALAYEHEQLLAGMAERMLRERAQRRRLFPQSLFGARGWDVLLILYRNRVQGRRSVPHNVAMELECPVREVDELVKALSDEQLTEWCDRYHYVRLSETGALRVRDYFIADGSSQQDEGDAGTDKGRMVA